MLETSYDDMNTASTKDGSMNLAWFILSFFRSAHKTDIHLPAKPKQ